MGTEVDKSCSTVTDNHPSWVHQRTRV